MTRVVIPFDNADGEPAAIVLEDWRREHAFMEAQRERPAVDENFWHGIKVAGGLLAFVICLAALFAWAVFG